MEIERKFLVKTLPDLSQYTYKKLSQAYISTNPVIRIRQMDYDFILTVKSSGHLSHEEFEIPISKEQYLNLYKKIEGNAIDKERYYIPIGNDLTAELDIYHGFLETLLTVEVEFTSEDAAHAFIPPNWFGEDITFDHRFKNNSLALHGIPSQS